MAFGFDSYKNKVEVYPASEVYTKDEAMAKDKFVVVQETVTIPQASSGSRSHGRISGETLGSKYGMTDLTKYILVGWSYSGATVNPHSQSTNHFVESDNLTDPYIEFDTRNNATNDNGVIVWGFQPNNSYTYKINVVFAKVEE